MQPSVSKARHESALMLYVQLYVPLALALAFPLAGSAGYSSFVGIKPDASFLTAFDTAFRRCGALLPFLPVAVRAMALKAVPSPGPPQSSLLASSLKAAVVYGGIQLIRYFIFASHLAGTRSGYWCPADSTSHACHTMSDHLLLGLAVQASLACEGAAAFMQLRWCQRYTEFQSDFQAALVMGLFWTSFSLACVLTALIGGDMFVTARFFHPPYETVVAMLLGSVLFFAPLHVAVQRSFY